jgi:hypothetical protein
MTIPVKELVEKISNALTPNEIAYIGLSIDPYEAKLIKNRAGKFEVIDAFNFKTGEFSDALNGCTVNENHLHKITKLPTRMIHWPNRKQNK